MRLAELEELESDLMPESRRPLKWEGLQAIGKNEDKEPGFLLKPLSKRRYVTAMARIEELMDAKVGTAEGAELDRLASLVHAYEEQYFERCQKTKNSSKRR